MSVFSIVIPAYNEEEAVESILRRALAAGEKIRSSGLGVTEVEVILVNDGSKDRTEALARGVAGIKVIGYKKNRGYGAAIKTGFEAAKGGLLGFIDADGTCDPLLFIDMIALLEKKGLDVALGSRMHAKSRMPAVRVLGNRIFRALVNALGDSELADVASGMRVLRRDALPRLAPLPDGLNFTPAMSARAALDKRLKLGELPMPYEERVGRSKLSVIGDGFRFLGIILDTAITFRPALFFGLTGAFALTLALLALAQPLVFYVQNGRVEDWMIFRLILVTIFSCAAAFMAGLGAVSQSLVAVINEEIEPSFWERLLHGALGRRFVALGLSSFLVAVALNRRLLAIYWNTGHIPNDYWVFALAGSLFSLVAAAFVGFALVDRIARLLAERERARKAMGSDPKEELRRGLPPRR